MGRAYARLHWCLVDEGHKHVSSARIRGRTMASDGTTCTANTKRKLDVLQGTHVRVLVDKPPVTKRLDVPWLRGPLMDRLWTVKDRFGIGPRLRQLDSKRREDGRQDRRSEMRKRTSKRLMEGNEARISNPCDRFSSCTGLGDGMAAMEAWQGGRSGQQERSNTEGDGAPAARNHGGDPRRRVQDGKRPSTASTRR